jgi:ribosomal protein L11 methyltransferase
MKIQNTQKLPAQAYFEIALGGTRKIGRFTEDAKNCLIKAGITKGRLVHSETASSFKIAFYTRSCMEVRRIMGSLERQRKKGFRLTVRLLGRWDWLDKWELYYRPSPLGKRFVVVPVRYKKKFRSGCRQAIFLDPRGAFGSGLHETTRLTVAAMERLAGKYRTFLDIGTGTGILAVTASKLGVPEVFGIDHDAPSIRTARANFKVNGCTGGTFVRVDLASIRFHRKYDLVAANLLSRTLLENRRKIQSAVKPGGYLLVSGVHRVNLRHFLETFSAVQFSGRKVFLSRSWAAVLWRRNP